jgi:putative Mn2+ efflux pump MntP
MRTSPLFTAFETAMPLVGIIIGRELASAIGSRAAYAAVGLLFALAIDTLVIEVESEQKPLLGPGVLSSVGVGLSISLDELTIGIALGLLRLPLVPVMGLIALPAFVFAQIGMRAGQGIGERIRERVEHLAGVTSAVLATRLLVALVVG